MRDFNLTDLKMFAALTFQYVDRDALDKLYRKYGDNSGEISDFTLFNKLAKNPDFATDYAQLAYGIFQNRYFLEDFENQTLHIYGDNSAFEQYKVRALDGDTADTPPTGDTSGQQNNSLFGWLTSAFGWLNEASSIGINWYDRLSGNYSTLLNTQQQLAQAEAQKQQNGQLKNTLLLVGIIVVVIVILILILIFRKK